MSAFQPRTMLRSAFLRPALSTAPRARFQVRLAQGYGSGEGDPVGEKPQEQRNNPTTENIEHPGPPPPKVGQNKPDSSSQSSSQSQTQSSNGGGGKSASGSEGGKASGGKSGKGRPQPKILNENPPGEHDESVRQHNEEMENRAEKAHVQVGNEDAKKDKAPPGYWSG